MITSRRSRFLLHWATAALVVWLSFAYRMIVQGLPPTLGIGAGKASAIVVALLIAGVAFVDPRRPLARLTTRCCAFLVALALALGLVEGISRAAGFDFSGERRKWSRIPPFYRAPTVESGEVFFRREGPESWRGQPRSEALRGLGIVPNPYRDEPVITITYDSNGFRNPEGLRDWQIAVAGDSFTELGHLPYPELFTTIMADRLGASVVNLGVSHTGPFTYLSYLRDYGVSPSVGHMVVVTFEGNDLLDLDGEWNDLMAWHRTGQRPHREFVPQSSFVRTLVQTLKHGLPRSPEPTRMDNAVFHSAEGDVPISVLYAPPNRSQLSGSTVDHLVLVFRQLGRFAERCGVTAWLVFMPCKERVLHGRITLAPGAAEPYLSWTPSDLPQFMADLAARNGIRFVDLTPALVAATNGGRRLVHNSIWDTHLNPLGSRAVAEELVRQFVAADWSSRPRHRTEAELAACRTFDLFGEATTSAPLFEDGFESGGSAAWLTSESGAVGK